MTLRYQVESRALGYPLDVVLELFNAAGGAPVARADDAGNKADAELTYAVPADGEYRIVVSDLYQHFGPRFVYRLRAIVATPDFRLTVDNHAFTVAAGKTLEIPIKIDRQQNFAGEIAFQLEGLPQGATVTPAKSLATGDSAKAVKLVVTAGAEPFAGAIRIVGESEGPIKHVAAATLPNRSEGTKDVWLTITAAK